MLIFIDSAHYILYHSKNLAQDNVLEGIMEDQPENGIFFEISSQGKVRHRPEYRIEATSHEMQKEIEKIIPQVVDYIEFLLKKQFD